MPKKIFGFTKNEFLVVSAIILSLVAVSLINLKISLRKSRDAQRKNDIRSIYDSLNVYKEDFGLFPLSSTDGKIIACESGKFDKEGKPILLPCEWGKDGIPPYLNLLPIDPKWSEGYSYYYVSTGYHYQVYASLESDKEDEFDPAILARNLPCGTKICNFGRSDGRAPLDKTLKEYENELDDKKAK